MWRSFVLPLALLAFTCAFAATTSEIKQNNITITFSKPVEYGQYANGDYWVLGPVTIAKTDPPYDPTNKRNGYEVDPSSTSQSGFDGRIGGFNATLVPPLPLVLYASQNFIKAISNPVDEKVAGCPVALLTVSILTVVSKAPAPDAFRPPYFKGAKVVYKEYTAAQFAQGLAKLPKFDLPQGDKLPTAADVQDWFQRPWLDHKHGWTGCQLHAKYDMPTYGSDVAARTGDAGMWMFMNLSASAQEATLIPYVQYGLDLYSIMLGGGSWAPNGGWQDGRKIPITLVAGLFDDDDIKKVVASANVLAFGESGALVHHPLHADIPLWGDDWYDNPKNPKNEEIYWGAVVTRNRNGQGRTIYDPYGWIDGGGYPGGAYQYCCNSKVWKSPYLPLYWYPSLQAIWNDTFFMDYVKRWVTIGSWAQPDQCAPATGTCSGGPNNGTACTSANPDKICGEQYTCELSMDGYGKDFGPDGKGYCILDTDPSDGTGRFPQLQGSGKDGGDHATYLMGAMWKAYGPKWS